MSCEGKGIHANVCRQFCREGIRDMCFSESLSHLGESYCLILFWVELSLIPLCSLALELCLGASDLIIRGGSNWSYGSRTERGIRFMDLYEDEWHSRNATFCYTAFSLSSLLSSEMFPLNYLRFSRMFCSNPDATCKAIFISLSYTFTWGAAS